MPVVSMRGFAAVINAQAFNPSIIREHWLIERGLLGENAIQPGFIFSDQAVQFATTDFVLQVLPQHLQVSPTRPDVAPTIMREFLAPLVAALPETPFVAAGVNLIWIVDQQPQAITEATRHLFLHPTNPLAPESRTEDARFGFYMSKDVGACRLKLDIKPVTNVPGVAGDVIQCAFNFHRDLAGATAAADIGHHLARWVEFSEISERMANLVSGGLE